MTHAVPSYLSALMLGAALTIVPGVGGAQTDPPAEPSAETAPVPTPGDAGAALRACGLISDRLVLSRKK